MDAGKPVESRRVQHLVLAGACCQATSLCYHSPNATAKRQKEARLRLSWVARPPRAGRSVLACQEPVLTRRVESML